MHIQRQNGFGLAKPALKFWLLGVILASIALSISVFSAPLEISTWQHWARYTARLSFIFFLITYRPRRFTNFTTHQSLVSCAATGAIVALVLPSLIQFI